MKLKLITLFSLILITIQINNNYKDTLNQLKTNLNFKKKNQKEKFNQKVIKINQNERKLIELNNSIQINFYCKNIIEPFYLLFPWMKNIDIIREYTNSSVRIGGNIILKLDF